MTRPLDEQLSAYLDGEVAASERAALEARLTGEPAAAERLESLRALDRALGGLGRIEPGPDFAEHFRNRLDRELAAQRLPWWRRLSERGALWWSAGALASAAIAVVLALWLGRAAPLAPELEQIAEIQDPDTWELLRAEDMELLEVLEILEAWDGVQES